MVDMLTVYCWCKQHNPLTHWGPVPQMVVFWHLLGKERVPEFFFQKKPSLNFMKNKATERNCGDLGLSYWVNWGKLFYLSASQVFLDVKWGCWNVFHFSSLVIPNNHLEYNATLGTVQRLFCLVLTFQSFKE